jgi:hypothetical protein
MAGPNTLPYGGIVNYPTWVFANTRLYVQNSDKHYPGKVTVWAAGNTEDVVVYGGHTDHIERYWGGVHISVTNTGGPPLTVWTA